MYTAWGEYIRFDNVHDMMHDIHTKHTMHTKEKKERDKERGKDKNKNKTKEQLIERYTSCSHMTDMPPDFPTITPLLTADSSCIWGIDRNSTGANIATQQRNNCHCFKYGEGEANGFSDIKPWNPCQKYNKFYVEIPLNKWTDGDRNTAISVISNITGVNTQGLDNIGVQKRVLELCGNDIVVPFAIPEPQSTNPSMLSVATDRPKFPGTN